MKYRTITHNGFKWAYDADGAHYFTKQLPNGKFALIRLLPVDLVNGNFEYMTEHGLSN